MTMKVRARKLLATQVLLALFWMGLLTGVSFLATPVKFLAPSLSLPVALDVGRQTFAVLNAVELLLALLLLLSAGFRQQASRQNRIPLRASLLLFALVLLQSLWLLPVLDARVGIILENGAVQESSLHLVYIAVDVLKLVLLGITGASVRGLLRP